LKNVGVLCGGSGSSKFVSAISNYGSSEIKPTFAANVGDNFWYHGLLVCPDIDISVYCLSGLLDTYKGWGIQGDSFKTTISSSTEWFSLGDRDLGYCLLRTEMYRRGWTLTSITLELCKRLGARFPVVPATDDTVQTFIRTSVGNLHLQEFWVKNGGRLEAHTVEYLGIERASPSEELLDIIKDFVLICPANPVSSVLPIVGLKGVSGILKKSRVVAVSPFIGDHPFSGPAANMMRAIGIETTSLGVARLYSRFLKIIFLEKEEDPAIVKSIRDIGVECIQTDTKIESEADKARIAKELIAAL